MAEPEPILVDNPKQTEELTPERKALIEKIGVYESMVDDDNPQWYLLKGATLNKQERFRPVNCFMEWDSKGVQVPKFAVERQNPPGAFHRNCDKFCEQFIKADAPPGLRKPANKLIQ